MNGMDGNIDVLARRLAKYEVSFGTAPRLVKIKF